MRGLDCGMSRKILCLVGCLLMATACVKTSVPDLMERFLWQKRQLVVFAPRLDDARLQQQRRILDAAQAGSEARDVVRWEIVDLTQVSLNGAVKPHLATDPFQRYFKVQSKDFTVLLLGKDGEVKQRWSEPVAAEAIFQLIDSMPMRQQEMGSAK